MKIESNGIVFGREPVLPPAQPQCNTPGRLWSGWQSICNAYESGVGHGKEHRTLRNPYCEGSDCWHAYAYGVSEGNRLAGRIEAAKA